jgi:hypothetical protein
MCIAALMVIGVLCVSCASIDPKEEYRVLYKITETQSTSVNGALVRSVMPFFRDSEYAAAIECSMDARTRSFMLTVVYIYDMKNDDKDNYRLNSVDIKIDNGRAITPAVTGQKQEYEKAVFNAKQMETITLRLEDSTVQSLRNCNSLTLILLGQTREMTQEALGKIKGFIEKYARIALG